MNWYIYALHTPDSLTLIPTITIFKDEEGSGIEFTWLVWGLGFEVES